MVVWRWFWFTRLSNLLLVLEGLGVIVGAYYTHERVPLADWLRDIWGFARKHYDRFAHFLVGSSASLPGPPSEPCGLEFDAAGSAGDFGCVSYNACGAEAFQGRSAKRDTGTCLLQHRIIDAKLWLTQPRWKISKPAL